MKLLLSLAALSLAALIGCQSTPRKLSMPISPDALSELRTSFQATDPDVKVGSVDQVLESSMYLTVGQINPSDFPIGSAVAIIDSNRQTVGFGKVVRTFDDSVHVSYEKKGIRTPHVGDAAVKFSEKF